MSQVALPVVPVVVDLSGKKEGGVVQFCRYTIFASRAHRCFLEPVQLAASGTRCVGIVRDSLLHADDFTGQYILFGEFYAIHRSVLTWLRTTSSRLQTFSLI